MRVELDRGEPYLTGGGSAGSRQRQQQPPDRAMAVEVFQRSAGAVHLAPSVAAVALIGVLGGVAAATHSPSETVCLRLCACVCICICLTDGRTDAQSIQQAVALDMTFASAARSIEQCRSLLSTHTAAAQRWLPMRRRVH